MNLEPKLYFNFNKKKNVSKLLVATLVNFKHILSTCLKDIISRRLTIPY